MCRVFFTYKSSKALVNPYTAEVSNPPEVILGFLANAKYARNINAYASSKNSFLSAAVESWVIETKIGMGS